MAPSKWRDRLPARKDRKDTADNPSQVSKIRGVPAQGLKLVAEGDQPVVDIIAIHGLNGHWEKTWTADNDVHWLRDLLPTDIPTARIFCWGYDASTHGGRVSCQYLYDHAKQLVSDLCLKRRLTGTIKRPIIFVTHSLGGVVLKSALIYSDAARKGALEEHHSIKMSTYGIIFMGAPHQGGSGVPFGKLLVNIASVFVAADDRLLKHLERDSEWLQQQLGQYSPISGELVTKFAYEEYKTPTALGQTIMVVPQASAVIPGLANAESIVIHADHREMVRFATKEDNGYETVSGHLQIMVQSADGAITQRWEDEGRVSTVRLEEKSFFLPFSMLEVSETDHFVARREELTAIHERLSNGTGRRIVTLHGLGGIGKTQLAIAYAKQYREDYTAILWLNIKDEASVKQSYSRIARRISQEHQSDPRISGLPEDVQENEMASKAKRWLENARNTRWLMIFDNYDNPKVSGNEDPTAVDIRKFLPEQYHGSIIIATRSSRVDIGQRIQLRKLGDLKDSLQILSDASHRQDIMDDHAAIELVKELDGLPLALATAGAYLYQVSTSFADYLRLYKASWLKLQQTSPQVTTYENRQLYSTWQLSLDHIKQQNSLSAMLLKLWAYFDNQDLWYELLRENRGHGLKWLDQMTEDELSFNEVIRVLCDHGLVEVDTSSEDNGFELQGYSMHSCVHEWTYYMVNRDYSSELAIVAIHCVGSHTPRDEAHTPWITRRRLSRHAGRCSRPIIDGKVDLDGNEWAICNFGNMHLHQGQYKYAEELFLRVLKCEGASLPSKHELILKTLYHLGFLYKEQGRLDEAEKTYLRVINSSEVSEGPENLLALEVMADLGNLYRQQGRFDGTEKLFLRALNVMDNLVGQEHHSTLVTVRNMALLYLAQGRLDEAEELLLRSLDGMEKTRGPEHPDTLSMVTSLAVLYQDQGRLHEAQKMYRRALDSTERVLGPEHPSALLIVYNLARLSGIQERPIEEEGLYLRALHGTEKTQGPAYPLALDARNNLGALYKKQGREDEAEEMYQRALEGKEKIFGPDHLSAIRIVRNLGNLYLKFWRLDEAEEMYKRAIHGYKKAMGQEAVKTNKSALFATWHLAFICFETGRAQEAEELYSEALDGCKSIYGPSHERCQHILRTLEVVRSNAAYKAL